MVAKSANRDSADRHSPIPERPHLLFVADAEFVSFFPTIVRICDEPERIPQRIRADSAK